MENQEKQHKRRVRYKGTHPRSYKEKYKELNPEKYPENTSLQRNARKYLMQGGRLGSGLGVTGADQAKFHVLS